VLHPKDDKLLEEDFGGATDLQRSQRHAQVSAPRVEDLSI
jgi:hypothetical protein